jgi:hydrogenase expression/formation protein HypC
MNSSCRLTLPPANKSESLADMEFAKMERDRANDKIGGGCRMCLAIPGKIVEIFCDNQDSALVDVVGVRRKVDLGLLQDDKPVPGDWVLIHVGFAMSKISEQDAADQMSTLRMLGEIDGAIEEVRGYGLEDAN